MASSTMRTFLFCVGVLLAAQLAMAASSPPAQSPSSSTTDCLSVALTLTDCLDYVEGNASKPSSACCKEASPVINNTPQCLCILFNKTLITQLGLTINTTLALELPKACKLTAPDPTLCTLLGYDVPGVPSASPSPTEAPSPESGATAPSTASASSSSPSASASQTATPSSSEKNNSASPALPLISIYSTALLSVAAAAALAF